MGKRARAKGVTNAEQRARVRAAKDFEQGARTIAQSVYNTVVGECSPTDEVPPQIMGPVLVAAWYAVPDTMTQAGLDPELRSAVTGYITGKILAGLTDFEHDEFADYLEKHGGGRELKYGQSVLGPDGAPLKR